MEDWRRIDRDELLVISGDDPYVRWATDPRVLAVAAAPGWACLHPWRPGGHWGGAFVGVDPGDGTVAGSAFEALAQLARDVGVRPEWFSTDRGVPLRLPSGWERAGTGEWDFMWADRVEDRAPTGVTFTELDDAADAEAIESFGRAHNRAFEGFPGLGLAHLWLGVERDGELLAVGALHALATGVPHMAGVVVHTEHRGLGLGRTLVAELSRRAIAGAGVSTLGVYHANLPAIALYEGLGYRSAHTFRTRDLTR